MTNKPPEQPAGARRWLPTLAAISCTVWVISNIAAIKPLQITGLRFITMDGGNLLFPISYILGDVLVEVYGYAQARRVIWLGVLLNLFAAGTFALVSALPPADGWHMQDAFATILRQTPRVALRSCFPTGSVGGVLDQIHHDLQQLPRVAADETIWAMLPMNFKVW